MVKPYFGIIGVIRLANIEDMNVVENGILSKYMDICPKTKAITDFHQLSPLVEQGYKLSNKFIADLQKIHDYIEHYHINLTR